jgi:hypothetical protein
MSHSPSRQKVERYYREQHARAAAARAEEEAKASAYAARIVALWNARAALKRPPSFYPTIATVISAGAPRLVYPDASISSLVPQLSCTRCCPNPPFARLLRLMAPL